MCDNLKTDRNRCEVCRTINLAKQVKRPKPDMQIYEKCTREKICPRVSELPVQPACIKVCSKEEYNLSRNKPLVMRTPHYSHGKFMYAVKAGILVGAVYFTYTQGVWGDQQEVTECIRRWKQYLRSINTRTPPLYDQCGKVIHKQSPESVFQPVYNVYKTIVTTCCAGVVKFPYILKCAYQAYYDAIEKKFKEQALERKIKKNRIA